MGVGRLAPYRVRAAYAKALAEIPLPVRSFTGIDPAALKTIGEAEIAGRVLEFGVLLGTSRLWVTMPGQVPPVLGYITGLDNGRYELHLTELDHHEWARHTGRPVLIKREAQAVWQAAQRECEG